MKKNAPVAVGMLAIALLALTGCTSQAQIDSQNAAILANQALLNQILANQATSIALQNASLTIQKQQYDAQLNHK